MRLATTEEGRAAIVYPTTQKVDVICTLFGFDMPVVLWESDMNLRTKFYNVVGESYLHDLWEISDFSWESIDPMKGIPDICIL